MYGWVEVEAEDEDDALEEAQDADMPFGEYIMDSFQVDYGGLLEEIVEENE